MKKHGLRVLLAVIVVSIMFSVGTVFAQAQVSLEKFNALEEKHMNLQKEVDKLDEWNEKTNIDMIVTSYQSAKETYTNEVSQLNQSINHKINLIVALITLWTLFGIIVPIWDRRKIKKILKEQKALKTYIERQEIINDDNSIINCIFRTHLNTLSGALEHFDGNT
jgi:hypothetical protein